MGGLMVSRPVQVYCNSHQLLMACPDEACGRTPCFPHPKPLILGGVHARFTDQQSRPGTTYPCAVPHITTAGQGCAHGAPGMLLPKTPAVQDRSSQCSLAAQPSPSQPRPATLHTHHTPHLIVIHVVRTSWKKDA